MVTTLALNLYRGGDSQRFAFWRDKHHIMIRPDESNVLTVYAFPGNVPILKWDHATGGWYDGATDGPVFNTLGPEVFEVYAPLDQEAPA